jgi:diaminohydroxyphosphoribosylaminopyrimidine deaminase/5-amino-6-(5-phosphoribosylamino)uracil reductase
MPDPNPLVSGKGLAILSEAGVLVECGLLEQETQALNPGFIKRMKEGRPFVRVKMAMSIDGRTALSSGESKWLTSTVARQDVQRLRARASAILTGIGTVLSDDPGLNVRLPDDKRQPLRVILDTELRTPPTAKTLSLDGAVLIFTNVADINRQAPLLAVGANIVVVPRSGIYLDLNAVMTELASRECNEIHTECGPTLAGSLLQVGLVDEIVIYIAPFILGNKARGLFQLPELTCITERMELKIIEVRAIGPDWRVTLRPQ